MSLAGDVLKVAPQPDTEPYRCRVCGHRIYCEESIAAGIERDCRRRLGAALKSADADVVAAYAIVLGGAA